MNKKLKGFTLIEVVIFIAVSAILAGTLLLSFTTILQKSPTARQLTIATQLAQQCMEWFVGQRRNNGYSSLLCPSTSVSDICSAPAGYTVSANIACSAMSGDANYKTITVTVSGLGNAVLTTLVADY